MARPRHSRLAHFGPIDECRLDFSNSLDHIEFDLLPRLRQAVVVLWPAFGHAGLETVGAIGDAVPSDRPEHLLIERFPVAEAAARLACNQGLKRLEHLKRCLDANRSRRGAILTGRLRASLESVT